MFATSQPEGKENTLPGAEQARNPSAQRFLAARRPGTGSTSEHSWDQLEARLEAVTRQAIQMLAEELRGEIKEEARILRAQMSELPAQSDFHDFRDSQVAFKEQLDWNTQMVNSLSGRTMIAEEAQTLLDAQLAQLDWITKKVTHIAEDSDAKARVSLESQEMRSATARCESAIAAVEALHQDVTRRLMTIDVLGITSPAAIIPSHSAERGSDIEPSAIEDVRSDSMPSREDVVRMHKGILDACAALRLDDVRAERKIEELRTDVTKHEEELDLLCSKCAELAKENQTCLSACVRALEELRDKVAQLSDLAEEQRHLPAGSAQIEKLPTVSEQTESEKILCLIEVLMGTKELHVASI